MTERRKRIAIVGGNFAGLTAAIKLPRRHAVTVIDPSTNFEWMPNIHEILSNVKTPQRLRLDRAAIVEQAGHRFLKDGVSVLQPAKGRLTTASGVELELAIEHRLLALVRQGKPLRIVIAGAGHHDM